MSIAFTPSDTITANTAAEPRTGLEMKLYYDTATSSDTPVWVLMKGIGDVSMEGLERGNAEIKSRDYDYTLSLPTIMGVPSITFKFYFGLDPASQALVMNDFMNKVRRKWFVASGDVTVAGTEGWLLPGVVSSLNWSQALEEASSYDCKVSAVALKNAAGTSLVKMQHGVCA